MGISSKQLRNKTFIIDLLHEDSKSLSEANKGSKLRYDFQEGNPVDKGFKWVLFLGRCVGCIPHSLSFKPSGGNVTFSSWLSLASANTVVLAFLGVILLLPHLYRCFLYIGSRPTILDEMRGLQGPVGQIMLASIPIYMLRSAPRLIQLFQRWSLTMKQLSLRTVDSGFPRFCLTISMIVLGMGVTENILYDVHFLNLQAEELEGNSFIEKLYKIQGMSLNPFIPHYSDFTSFLVVYFNKFGTYCWNFSDILIIVFCRALSYKFTQLNHELEKVGMSQLAVRTEQSETCVAKKKEEEFKQHSDEEISATEKFCTNCIVTDSVWEETREKLFALIDLTNDVTRFVSPLVLTCFGCNMFLIILNILRFIYDGVENSADVYVSTVQFVMRVILVTYHSSQVYHSTEQIQQTIERISDKIFCPAASRLERMLARHPVGVTIFGAMVITRKFFISILSFLFTTEIVLLQAMSTSMARKTGAYNLN